MNLLGRLATGALKRPKVRSTPWPFPIALVPRLCGPTPRAQVIPSLAIPPPCPVHGSRKAMAQPHFITLNCSQPDVEQEIRTVKEFVLSRNDVEVCQILTAIAAQREVTAIAWKGRARANAAER